MVRLTFHPRTIDRTELVSAHRIGRLVENIGIFLICLYIVTHFFRNLTAVEEISFYGACLISGFGSIFKKKKFTFAGPLNVPLALFVVWAFIGLFFALNKPNSVHDFYAHLLKYLVFYYLLINYFDSPRKLALLAWTIILSATCFCLGGMLYFYGIVGYDWTTRFLLYPPHFVTYHEFLLTLAFLLILYELSVSTDRKMKIFLICCSAVISAAVLLTQTRGAVLAVAASFFLFRKFRKYAIPLTLLLVTASLLLPIKERFFNTDDIVSNDRMGTTRIYLQVVKDNPVAGVGFGMQTYDQKFLEIYTARSGAGKTGIIEVPHNVLLSVAVRTGGAGMIFYLMIWIAFLKTGLRMAKKGRSDFVRSRARCVLGCFCPFFILAMFSDASFGRAAVVFYTLMGMMTIVWKLDREEGTCRSALP